MIRSARPARFSSGLRSVDIVSAPYCILFYVLPLHGDYVIPPLPAAFSGPEKGEAHGEVRRGRKVEIHVIDPEGGRRGGGIMYRLPVVRRPVQAEGGRGLDAQGVAALHRAHR